MKTKQPPHNRMLSALGLNNNQVGVDSVCENEHREPVKTTSTTECQKKASEKSTERVQSSEFMVKHSSTPIQITENKGD